MGGNITGPLGEQDLLALQAFLVEGKTGKQIWEELGVTRARLTKLLARQDVKDAIEEQRNTFRQSIAVMSDEVAQEMLRLIRKASDPVKVSIIEKWLRAMGLYQPDQVMVPTSAEDVAKALLAGGLESKKEEEDDGTEVKGS